MGTELDALFLSFRTEIETDQELREEIRVVVRDLEQKSREISTILQKIHQTDGIKRIPEFCSKANEEFVSVQNLYKNLGKLIPNNEYFKYYEHYRYTNQRMVFLAAMVYFLEKDAMISRQDAAQVLGIKVNRSEGFHLDLEDYLMGLLNLASELSRFSVNCVTCGDFGRPFKIATFLNDLDSGFRLLNLKNDNLRKRFDALKYDVKKVEEVVYDLSIRGLKQQVESAPT